MFDFNHIEVAGFSLFKTAQLLRHEVPQLVLGDALTPRH